MRRLIVIAQKVNAEDDLLGFFIGWLEEFAKNFDRVDVIAQAVGAYNFSDNIKVFSLGKEKGASKFSQFLEFYRLLFRLVPNSVGIFAHMSPIFAIYSWPIAFLFQKKIILWYLHRQSTLRLKIAGALCYKITTAAKESLTLKSEKVLELGHGIDFERFNNNKDWNSSFLNILSVGRISKIKNFETLIKTAGKLRKDGLDLKIEIVGRPIMPTDRKYMNQLVKMISDLGLDNYVKLVGFIPFSKIPDYYKRNFYFVGALPLGGIDKAMLEAMAEGCLVVTSNTVFSKYFGVYSDKLIFKYQDAENLAEKLKTLSQMDSSEKQKISAFLKNQVREHHNLINLAKKISRLFA